MHRWRAHSIVVGIVVISLQPRHGRLSGSSRAVGAYHRLTTMAGRATKAHRRIATVGDAVRRIRALEARSRKQHEQLLEDTQALADAYDGLVQQNADRIAEIATLKKEIAIIRAELSALKAGPAINACRPGWPTRPTG